jgi:hypothetical protein
MAHPMSRGFRLKLPLLAFTIFVVWFLFPARDKQHAAPIDLPPYVGGSGSGKATDVESSPDHSSASHSAAAIAQADHSKNLEEQYHIEFDELEKYVKGHANLDTCSDME